MSDPIPSPVTDTVAGASTDTPVAKPSDLGSFNPPTIPELTQRIEVLEGQMTALQKSSDSGLSSLLRKQMDYLINTYFREPHFPKE